MFAECGVVGKYFFIGLPTVSTSHNADKMWSAFIYLFKAYPNDLPRSRFLGSDAPMKIDLGEIHTALAAEFADLREYLFHVVRCTKIRILSYFCIIILVGIGELMLFFSNASLISSCIPKYTSQ